MIIFGTNQIFLDGQNNVSCSCPECDKNDEISFVVYDRYFHLFWIPIFVYYKSGLATCENCGTTWKPSKMPEHIKRKYKEFKGETKLPFWHFSGLIIILLFTLYIWYSHHQEQIERKERIENPMIGDVYYYNNKAEYIEIPDTLISNNEESSSFINKLRKFNGEPEKSFSTYRVIYISKDSIFVYKNNSVVFDKRNIFSIDKIGNYFEDRIGFSRKEIEEMLNKKDIFDIKRD